MLVEDVSRLVKEVFFEASKGLVKIDSKSGYWNFYLRFYEKINGISNCYNDKYPVIDIPSYNNFIEAINSYLENASFFYDKDKDYFDLEEESFYKKLILDLFISASNYDFNNIINYIERKNRMLINNTITFDKLILGNYNGLEIVAKIDKTTSNLEAPYKMKFYFIDKENNIFNLPSVTFGLIDNVAYLMCIQNTNKKQDNKLAKSLDRYFRKVNKGIDLNSDISNISPNSLVSLTLFIAYLKNNGIDKIIAFDYLPLRYNGNKIMIYHKYKDKEELSNALIRHDKDQFNMTNKFMYLFKRYCYHFKDCDYYYDDLTRSMQVKLERVNFSDDNIIFDLDRCVSDTKKALNNRVML
jgi:hypothetical protein